MEYLTKNQSSKTKTQLDKQYQWCLDNFLTDEELKPAEEKEDDPLQLEDTPPKVEEPPKEDTPKEEPKPKSEEKKADTPENKEEEPKKDE